MQPKAKAKAGIREHPMEHATLEDVIKEMDSVDHGDGILHIIGELKQLYDPHVSTIELLKSPGGSAGEVLQRLCEQNEVQPIILINVVSRHLDSPDLFKKQEPAMGSGGPDIKEIKEKKEVFLQKVAERKLTSEEKTK